MFWKDNWKANVWSCYCILGFPDSRTLISIVSSIRQRLFWNWFFCSEWTSCSSPFITSPKVGNTQAKLLTPIPRHYLRYYLNNSWFYASKNKPHPSPTPSPACICGNSGCMYCSHTSRGPDLTGGMFVHMACQRAATQCGLVTVATSMIFGQNSSIAVDAGCKTLRQVTKMAGEEETAWDGYFWKKKFLMRSQPTLSNLALKTSVSWSFLSLFAGSHWSIHVQNLRPLLRALEKDIKTWILQKAPKYKHNGEPVKLDGKSYAFKEYFVQNNIDPKFDARYCWGFFETIRNQLHWARPNVQYYSRRNTSVIDLCRQKYFSWWLVQAALCFQK